MLLRGRVLVGVGTDPERARTSKDAVEFLKRTFPDKEIVPIAIRASDDTLDNPREHVLHLDCGFQPIGADSGILFEGGFEGRPEAILDLVGDHHIIRVSGDEMFHLWPNLFSISPTKVVSAPNFTRLNEQIRSLGVSVLEVPYEEVAKLGGLFRCSTLPIRRTYVDQRRTVVPIIGLETETVGKRESAGVLIRSSPELVYDLSYWQVQEAGQFGRQLHLPEQPVRLVRVSETYRIAVREAIGREW